jgi:hypothetical protein
MDQPRRLSASWLAVFFAIIPVAGAQQNAPHVGYVYPAGGRQGTTFQVMVGGQFLVGVTSAYISGGGVQATAVDYTRPLTPQQVVQLREKLQELQKREREAAVLKEIAGIREQIAAARRRNANPVLAETVTLQVTVAADAEPGMRELKLATPLGLSNPLVFCIGQLPEFSETPPKIGVGPQNGAAGTEMNISLPAVVNGQIVPRVAARPQAQTRPGQQFTPGNVDRYRFQARQGQQLVIAAFARELTPYLADAVPGWFQATLALCDADGKELSYDDDYRFHPDPVLHYEVPRDGEYMIEIKDALYRGREDFVYRISLGELPFVTNIFPLGGRAGARTGIDVQGWNLPADKLTMDAGDKRPGIYPLFVHKGELVSNSVPFMVDTLPESLEKEPNSSQNAAQRVKLPIVVNGHIDQPGDWDVFSFDGRAGDEVVAEVYARGLDSPLDSVLKLTDAAGRQLAFNDDHEDKGSGWITHHADSLIMATLPAKGTYYLHLGDAQQKGGLEYAYRLRISAPRPDFDLRVVPSSINAAPGMTVPLTVYALRRDGFSGDIALALKDAPRGFALAGGLVPAGQDQVRLTITAPPPPLSNPLSLTLQGRALIQRREIIRVALPAEDMMQAFAYHHLVPASDLKVAVMRRAAFRAPVRILGEQPVRIPAGRTVRIRVQYRMPANNPLGEVQFELSEPPEGVGLRELLPVQEGTDLVLQCDAAKAKPGLRGNLIVAVFAERSVTPANQNARPTRRRIALGTLPAIPFEIVRE